MLRLFSHSRYFLVENDTILPDDGAQNAAHAGLASARGGFPAIFGRVFSVPLVPEVRRRKSGFPVHRELQLKSRRVGTECGGLSLSGSMEFSQ